MSMIIGVYLGLIAGMAPSPHNAGILDLWEQRNKSKIIVFSLGALFFDLALIFFGWSMKRAFQPDSLFLGVVSLVAATYFAKVFFKKKSTSGTFLKLGGNQIFLQGFMVQCFNPNPWLFWTSAGFFQMVKNPFFPLLFLLTTYLTKILVLPNILKISKRIAPVVKQSFGVLSLYYSFIGFRYLMKYF